MRFRVQVNPRKAWEETRDAFITRLRDVVRAVKETLSLAKRIAEMLTPRGADCRIDVPKPVHVLLSVACAAGMRRGGSTGGSGGDPGPKRGIHGKKSIKNH